MKGLIVSAAVALLTSVGLAADTPLVWPQFRGPNGSGVADGQKPPVEIGPEKNVKWKVEIPGHGKSTPIVWGNRVFVITAVDTGKVVEGKARPEDQPDRPFGIKYPNTLFRFVVQCLDRETGKVVWERAAVEELPHEGHHGDNSHATASPTTDGRYLYVSFGSRGLYCYDLAGELRFGLHGQLAHDGGLGGALRDHA